MVELGLLALFVDLVGSGAAVWTFICVSLVLIIIKTVIVNVTVRGCTCCLCNLVMGESLTAYYIQTIARRTPKWLTLGFRMLARLPGMACSFVRSTGANLPFSNCSQMLTCLHAHVSVQNA